MRLATITIHVTIHARTGLRYWRVCNFAGMMLMCLAGWLMGIGITIGHIEIDDMREG